LSVLVDDKLAEINDSIVTLMGCVDEMEKRIEELEFEGDFEELRGEMQAAVNSMAANVTKDVQALRASQDACKAKMEAYKAKVGALENQLQVCMAMLAKLSNGGLGQVSTSLKGSVLQTPTYDGAGNAREIDNFFWGLEAYFEATCITDEGQKVSHASFSLKDTALLWWRHRCDDVN